jgi:hypothetical protein
LDEQEDRRRMWRKVEFASVSAVVVTLVFVFIGQSAEQLATTASLEHAQADKVKPQFDAADYASTGSTSKAPVVIGPCATRQP